MADPLLALMFDFGSYSWLAKLSYVIQIGMMIHAFKTGRPFWWFWILLMAPVVGPLAYFFFEILPDLRRPDTSGFWQSLKPRSLHIRDLRMRMEEIDTFDSRMQLAEALLHNGDAAAAREIAEGGLTGVFQQDPSARAEVARYRLEAGDPAGALSLLETGPIEGDRLLEMRIRLLHGRALLGTGRHKEAAEVLQRSMADSSGECARFHYAKALIGLGQTSQAIEILESIRQKYRRGNRSWRKTERQWFKASKDLLNSLKR